MLSPARASVESRVVGWDLLAVMPLANCVEVESCEQSLRSKSKELWKYSKYVKYSLLCGSLVGLLLWSRG